MKAIVVLSLLCLIGGLSIKAGTGIFIIFVFCAASLMLISVVKRRVDNHLRKFDGFSSTGFTIDENKDLNPVTGWPMHIHKDIHGSNWGNIDEY